MQVIAKATLRAFWTRHPAAETPLRTWHVIASRADWAGPADVKRMFGTGVDFVGDSRAIFDIGGNKFRIVAHCAYPYRRVLIKFVGTHAEYDKFNAETI
ncbi:type II toxin-antitoxin system HigB family toxin [soil metagenome]